MRANPLIIHRKTDILTDYRRTDIINNCVVGDAASVLEDRVLLERRSSHPMIVDHCLELYRRGSANNSPGTVGLMKFGRRPRWALTAALAVSAVLVLSGCEKPAPGVSVFSGTTTKNEAAVCWAFDTPSLEPGDCAQDLITQASSGQQVARIPVVPGDTVGISVDKVVAESGWTPVIGQQRLTSTPLSTPYFRFTFPDLQEVPEDGVLLQVVAGRGDSTRGIWIFRLVRA